MEEDDDDEEYDHFADDPYHAPSSDGLLWFLWLQVIGHVDVGVLVAKHIAAVCNDFSVNVFGGAEPV